MKTKRKRFSYVLMTAILTITMFFGGFHQNVNAEEAIIPGGNSYTSAQAQ